MKPLPAVLLLMSAALTAGANSPAEVQQAIAENEATLSAVQAAYQAADKSVTELVGQLPPPPSEPDNSMPARSGTDTVAVADGGLLFDANNYRLVYIHNVRVADPRLELRSADRLYIQFPRKTVEKGKSSAQNTVTTGLNKSPNPAAQPVADKEQAADEAPTKGSTPVCISAATTVVDAVTNLIYLESAMADGSTITLSNENNELKLTSAEDKTATLLASPDGNLLLKGASIDLKWIDRNGSPCTLHNEQGSAYYNAATHELHFPGYTAILTADGTIHSNKLLTLKLIVKETEKKSSFMPQFTSIRIEGIETATAEGQVQLTRPATEGAPTAAVNGEKLSYDSTSGEVTISGPQTTLTYGEQRLSTDGSLHLAGNGDISLQGNNISGNYSRPSGDKSAPPIIGSFSTSGELTFTAATHTITLPNGLQAKDELSTISANGKVDLLLQPGAQPNISDNEKTGKLNLAIAQHKDIVSVHATGGVNLQHRSNPQEPGLTIAADDAQLNFQTAEATFTSAAGKLTDVSYNGHRLSAISENSNSSLHLATNGDLSLQGDTVSATLPGKTAPINSNCRERMVLEREAGLLVLGPKSRVTAPEGILSANGELKLQLYPGPEAKNRPAIARYPQLVYNYAGLKQADTANGGTVQAKQGSMECHGPIHIEMLEESAAEGPMGSIRTATAAGGVALAGKDSTGRMLRATGDMLTIDGATGSKVLSGDKVIVQDARNTHTASGGGARIELDSKNNVRISGAKQSTSATRIHEQIDKDNNKK